MQVVFCVVGTAILWHKNLINMGINVKLIHRDEESRFITVMLAKQLVLSCVYLPCHSAGTDYEVELSSVLARLEGILDKYSDRVHIVAGDYNFECSASHKGYNLFSDLVSTYNFECMDNEQDDCGYTFFTKLWVDHGLIKYWLVILYING